MRFLKENKGAVSVLVFISVLTFLTVLLGVFLTVTTLRQGQLRSDKRLQEIYGKDIDNIDDIYGQLQIATNGQVTMNTTTLKQLVLDTAYPVGSIYITIDSKNPSETIGGTWEAYGQGRTLVGLDTNQTEFNTVGKTGGEKTHTLTVNEMPSHTHTRGTMDITGKIVHNNTYSGAIYSSEGNSTASLGAFGLISAYTGTGTQQYYLSGRSNGSGWSDIDFKASRAWTGATSSEGGSQAHNNLQPYITVYMWKRTS